MFLSHRARVVSAKENGVPAEDVLRLVRPREYVPVLAYVKAAFASKAADEGIAFVRMMSNHWKGPVHPAFTWQHEVSSSNDGPRVSTRAAGVIKSVKDVVDTIKDECREAVFGKKVLAFRMRKMYIDLATSLCTTLVPILPDVPDAVDEWLNTPWTGSWPFELSCKGCKVKPGREGDPHVQGWCTQAGCYECRRHIVLVIRGVTQLACRLKNVDDPACTWMLRATHSSDESRFPFEKRQSACTTARRIVRGNPGNPKSVDFWPGRKAEGRPPASIPSGEPMAEPSDGPLEKMVLRKSLSDRANPSNESDELVSPPAIVQKFLRGETTVVPRFPLCDLGLTTAEVDELHGMVGGGSWRDEPFQIGRVPFDSKYCAVWHALFESFAPVERVLAPVFRLLIRARSAELTGRPEREAASACDMAFHTATESMDLGVSSAELQCIMRAHVEDLPPEVVKVIASRQELVDDAKGQLVPYGVIGGMVFAMVTRASYYARKTWYEALDWSKLSSMLRGLLPQGGPDKKVKTNPRRGFDTIVDAKNFEVQHGLVPVQPDDHSRVWGVNSFAVLPMFGRAFSEEAAQQPGFRMPAASFQEMGNHSGLWLAVVDPDAAVTVPGTAEHVKSEAMGREVSGVKENAGVLGKLFVKWFENCTNGSGETQTLVDNAMGYAEKYKLEAGLRRNHSRAGVSPTRAGWFVRDFPSPMRCPEWCMYEALSEKLLPMVHRVNPYRITECTPTSPSLSGSLKGAGYLYQFVARIQALVQLLVEIWLTPTVRYENRVAITEVLTRAIEACHQMIGTGLLPKHESPSYGPAESSWPYNSVLDNAVFMVVFGIVVNEASTGAGMLQVQIAGTAPGVGEYHYAFASDCFGWSTQDRSFLIVPAVGESEWDRACSKLVEEWSEQERAYMQDDHSVQTKWMSGGPVRATIGGIGGNRWLLMVPEPVTAEVWRAVSGNLRNAKMTRLEDVDRLGDAQVSLAERAKQLSAGGSMTIFSSRTGARRQVIPWGNELNAREQALVSNECDGSAGMR